MQKQIRVAWMEGWMDGWQGFGKENARVWKGNQLSTVGSHEMREASFRALGTPLARQVAGKLRPYGSDTAPGNLQAGRQLDSKRSAHSAGPIQLDGCNTSFGCCNTSIEPRTS